MIIILYGSAQVFNYTAPYEYYTIRLSVIVLTWLYGSVTVLTYYYYGSVRVLFNTIRPTVLSNIPYRPT